MTIRIQDTDYYTTGDEILIPDEREGISDAYPYPERLREGE